MQECEVIFARALSRAEDLEIVNEARLHDEVIVTHDLDYGHLLAFSGQPKPSIIIFRTRNTKPGYMFERLKSSWIEVEKPLTAGTIVVLEDASLRIRNLPVSQFD